MSHFFKLEGLLNRINDFFKVNIGIAIKWIGVNAIKGISTFARMLIGSILPVNCPKVRHACAKRPLVIVFVGSSKINGQSQ